MHAQRPLHTYPGPLDVEDTRSMESCWADQGCKLFDRYFAIFATGLVKATRYHHTLLLHAWYIASYEGTDKQPKELPRKTRMFLP